VPGALGQPGRRVWRVRGRRGFADLRRAGRRARRGPITVTWVAASPGGPPRVGYAVGRDVGGAVVRNRLRRRLRGVVADLAPSLAPGTYLIGAGPAAVELSPADLRATVASAAAVASAVRGAGPVRSDQSS
jgi:ribonuclease P protein component